MGGGTNLSVKSFNEVGQGSIAGHFGDKGKRAERRVESQFKNFMSEEDLMNERANKEDKAEMCCAIP